MTSTIRRMISILVVGVLTTAVILSIRQRYKVELVNNDDAVVLNAPSFSCASGFYQREFDLEIFSDEGSSIYYTLDGSVPDEQSFLYQNPIHVYDRSGEANIYNMVQNTTYDWKDNNKIISESVPKAFVIRAMSIDENGRKSDVVTATYFVNQEAFKDGMVLSLNANPDDLFGETEGILVTGAAYDKWYLNKQIGTRPMPNFMQSGDDWERPVCVEVFKAGSPIMTQNVGMRVQGASTREEHKKRMRLIARKKYSGSNQFATQIFGENKSGTWLLRGSYEDIFLQDLMDNTNLARQRGELCYTFLNGEYWYAFPLREYYDAIFFENYFGIQEDNLIVYKNGEIEEGTDNDKVYYDQLFNFVQSNDLTEDSNYEYVQQLMDVQSYIEYLCGNIYCANMDSSEIKNVMMWRSRVTSEEEYQDGKWRWALYDMDALGWLSLEYYGVDEPAQIDSFSVKGEHVKSAWNEGVLYDALKENDDFRKQFVLTFMDMMNTSFSIQNVVDKLERFELDTTWRQSFFVNRPKYMKEYLKKEFDLQGTAETLHIKMSDNESGSIIVNSKEINMDADSWSGLYYTDYPITITVLPKEGYEFVGWSGDIESTEKTLELNLSIGGMDLVAEFIEKN